MPIVCTTMPIAKCNVNYKALCIAFCTMHSALQFTLPFAYCTMHTACCTLHNVVHIVPPKTSSAQLCERKRRRYRRVLGSQSIGTRPNDYDEDPQDHDSDNIKRFSNCDVRQNLSRSCSKIVKLPFPRLLPKSS